MLNLDGVITGNKKKSYTHFFYHLKGKKNNKIKVVMLNLDGVITGNKKKSYTHFFYHLKVKKK